MENLEEDIVTTSVYYGLNCKKKPTSSVSPELLQRFARALAPLAFLRIMALLSIIMTAIRRASFLQSCEQADQCNNSGETEEVFNFMM